MAGRGVGQPAAGAGRQPGLRDLLTRSPGPRSATSRRRTTPRLAAAAGRERGRHGSGDGGRIFAALRELKRDRGVIDFEDILFCTAALLSDHDEVRAQVRRTYRHLVVDEYQDVSPLQQQLLDLWRGDKPDLCVVGDPAQTIHSFAGARSSFLTRFARRHPTPR